MVFSSKKIQRKHWKKDLRKVSTLGFTEEQHLLEKFPYQKKLSLKLEPWLGQRVPLPSGEPRPGKSIAKHSLVTVLSSLTPQMSWPQRQVVGWPQGHRRQPSKWHAKACGSSVLVQCCVRGPVKTEYWLSIGKGGVPSLQSCGTASMQRGKTPHLGPILNRKGEKSQNSNPKWLFSPLVKTLFFPWKRKIKGKTRFHGRSQNEAKGFWFWCAVTFPSGSSCPRWEMYPDPRGRIEIGRGVSHVLPSWLTPFWLGCRTELSAELGGSVNGLPLISLSQSNG